MNFRTTFTAFAILALMFGGLLTTNLGWLPGRDSGFLFMLVFWPGFIPHLLIVFAPSLRWWVFVTACLTALLGWVVTTAWLQSQRGVGGPGDIFGIIIIFAACASLVTASLVRACMWRLRMAGVFEGYVYAVAFAGMFINPTLAVIYSRWLGH
jgi:hypothetical protein